MVRHRRGHRLCSSPCAPRAPAAPSTPAGGNPTAAVYTGIDVGRTQFIAFCISGTIAGFCGYLWVSRYTIAYVDIAGGFELDVIAACVIGGVSIAGGIGTVAGAVLGALFLGVVKNALPVIHVSPFWQLAISGAAILVAVIINAGRERRTGRLILKEAAADMTNAAATAGSSPTASPAVSAAWKRWEVILLAVAAAIFIFNAFASPYFLNPWNLSDATFNFTEKAMIAFAMALLIIAGEIDLSVASIIALSSTAMGAAAAAGFGPAVLVVIGLAVGARRRRLQRLLVTRFRIPSIVVTIGTMSLFRGIAYVVLGDQAYRRLPAGLRLLRPGLRLVGVLLRVRPLLALAVRLRRRAPSHHLRPARLRHRQQPGRGAVLRRPRRPHPLPAVRADRLMSGVAAVLLTSRIGSTRPTIATGWELEVVTMVVLGGVNILGGSGTIPGVVIAAFVMGLVTFGFGLLNVPGIVMSIFIGSLLIAAIALPIVAGKIVHRRRAA